MEESWAGVFREHILRELPVDKIAPYFSEGSGRPTKELYAALGSLILQQMHDLTDEETVDEFCFDIKWHYALDIPGESDESKYLSLKTLWTLRHLVMAKGLDVALFNRTTELLAKAFRVDTSKQRIDSVHIRSNMKRLGRLGIFSRSIHVFLVNLKRQRPAIFETIDKELVDRYLTEKALGCFSLVKPSESGKTLEMVARDLFSLVRRFREDREVNSLHSYNAQLQCPGPGFEGSVSRNSGAGRSASGGGGKIPQGGFLRFVAESVRSRRRIQRPQGSGVSCTGDGDLL